MRMIVLILLLAGCAAAPKAAEPAPSAAIVLDGPAIVRDSPETGPDSQVAAYVRIRNSSAEPDRLIALSCACADKGEMHATYDRAMHVLPSLDIPANGALEIAPGGPTHLMLMGLKAPIATGDVVRITLSFERSAPLEADFVAVDNSKEGWAARDK